MTEVRPARDAAEVRAALDLRHEVFVIEQHVPVEEEYDDHDDTALHLVAVDGDGRIVATARVVMDGTTAKLGRVAVAKAARRRGIASRLIEQSEAHARAAGATRVLLAAQTGALPLYEKAGYTAYGERFMDANLEHLMMQKHLD